MEKLVSEISTNYEATKRQSRGSKHVVSEANKPTKVKEIFNSSN
jgi:hypothetical protein